MRHLGLVLALFIGPLSWAGKPPPTTVVVLTLKSNPAASAAAPGATALIASHLSKASRLKIVTESDLQTALSVERQKQMLGAECSEDRCIAELSGAMGARYVLHGRLDRFGSRYALTASLYDGQRAEVIAKPSAEVEDGALPSGARSVADAVLLALGIPPELETMPIATHGPTLGLRVSSTFIARLLALNPGADLELGWRLGRGWIPFLQIGFNFVRAQEDGGARLTVVPTVLGLRSFHFLDGRIHPYWGMGVGAQFTGGSGAAVQSQVSVLGMLGVQGMLTERFGVSIEGSTNLIQTFSGLRQGGFARGFNFDLSLGLSYLF
jgi:TolB-like protein